LHHSLSLAFFFAHAFSDEGKQAGHGQLMTMRLMASERFIGRSSVRPLKWRKNAGFREQSNVSVCVAA
jgi:hypothetical protein